jgi:nicotinate phosphoribosyltransferase
MIIRSLLDTDLYKFTMMQVVLHHFPQAQVEYRFKCRNSGVDLTPYVDEIRSQITQLCQLRFTDDELDYLRGLRFIKSDFVEFLALFHLNEKYVQVLPSVKGNGEIEIIIKGPWLHTILFEIPLLAIVNEVYFRRTQPKPDLAEGRRRLQAKLELLAAPPYVDCVIADYGTRRRFSRDWQEEVLLSMRDAIGPQLAGTSNVHFARLHNMTPLGTMAHEYLQACQALGRACVIRRSTRWSGGHTNIAATLASRFRTPTASTHSCGTSISISASFSTACDTTRAIRSNGASG